MRTVHGWPKYTLALRPPLLWARLVISVLFGNCNFHRSVVRLPLAIENIFAETSTLQRSAGIRVSELLGSL